MKHDEKILRVHGREMYPTEDVLEEETIVLCPAFFSPIINYVSYNKARRYPPKKINVSCFRGQWDVWQLSCGYSMM